MATAAASAGVIVPVEVVEAGAAGNSSLALAQHQRAIAASLLEAVASAVHGQRHALAAQSGDIDVERIAASEALLIAREEQVRATVRAEFARQRQAQEEAAMAQQLAQFQQPGVRPQ
ncbi:MAG: hypothetical protein HC857_06575 [Synechococcales cyanobacterium RU_4_20]|nr:hypothetical protein [Synechococcales cyanobacterium RU_4_20]